MEFITLLTPELYEIPKESSEFRVKVHKPIQLFTRRALEVFSRNEFVKIFTKLVDKKYTSKDNVAPDTDDENPETTCNCNRTYDDCPGFMEFCQGMCVVPPGGGNCGAGGVFICNGVCKGLQS